MIRGDLPARAAEPSIPGEDLLATVALKKTVAFVLYQLLAWALWAPVVFLVVPQLPRPAQDAASWSSLAVLELALLFLVVRGWLPATGGDDVREFSERQLALGCHAVSAGAWVLGAGLQHDIVQWVANGALALGACVYFVSKSVLSRRPRWRVLGVLVLPAVQLAVELVR